MLIENFFRFVGRVAKQPSYVVNAIRFVEWSIENATGRHWPHRDVSKPRSHPFKSLLVVLRSSDAVQHCSPASRGLEEYGIFDKRDVVRRCGESFAAAVRTFRERMPTVDLRIALVEDRLSDEGKAVYLSCGGIEEHVSPPGNRETFLSQVEIARQADDDVLVCLLEDDYLLDQNVFCEAFELFNSSTIDGFTPHFHPGIVDSGGANRIFCLNGKFYTQVKSTTCTFFISAKDIRRNLTRLRRYYGSELGNINEIWRHGVCLAPCCRTLAEHMHRSDLSYVWSGC